MAVDPDIRTCIRKAGSWLRSKRQASITDGFLFACLLAYLISENSRPMFYFCLSQSK